MTIALIIILSLVPKQSQAQNNGAAVAAVAGGLIAVGAGIAAVEDMKERAKLAATQYVLANHP